jgi:hypothetical protein
MQTELNAEASTRPGSRPIHILGVNEAGQESDNGLVTSGRHCPWLQDTSQENVWSGKWGVTWRDVVVLDAENRKITVYNLTQQDLYTPANYAALKNILIQAATP